MKVLNMVSWVLLIVGGLNWGLVAFAQYNLVDALLGVGTMPSKIVYGLVALAALWSLVMFVKCCQNGTTGGSCCSN